ncbi:MAG: hypothetical protein LBS84_07295, partial [Clostridiales bacterium]|nr:hypothetical protein [Clostridiales bacterium]
MRKMFALLASAVCFVFALSGCEGKAPVNPNARNENGTVAVNLPDNSTSAIVPDENGEQATEQTSVDTPAQTESPEQETADASGEVIEIREKMFIAQTNDIYFNAEDYLGKMIKYEGIFTVYEIPETGVKYCSVIRYGPGCCGVDANAGFEVIW